jgi:transposase
MTYSIDYRRKVLQIKEAEGLTFAETSARFGVGIDSVVRWLKKLEPQRTRDKPATKIDMEALKRDVEAHPDAYQYERAKRLNVSRNCIHFALKRLHVTYQKKLMPPKGSSRKAVYLLPKASNIQGGRTPSCLFR